MSCCCRDLSISLPQRQKWDVEKWDPSSLTKPVWVGDLEGNASDDVMGIDLSTKETLIHLNRTAISIAASARGVYFGTLEVDHTTGKYIGKLDLDGDVPDSFVHTPFGVTYIVASTTIVETSPGVFSSVDSAELVHRSYNGTTHLRTDLYSLFPTHPFSSQLPILILHEGDGTWPASGTYQLYMATLVVDGAYQYRQLSQIDVATNLINWTKQHHQVATNELLLESPVDSADDVTYKHGTVPTAYTTDKNPGGVWEQSYSDTAYMRIDSLISAMFPSTDDGICITGNESVDPTKVTMQSFGFSSGAFLGPDKQLSSSTYPPVGTGTDWSPIGTVGPLYDGGIFAVFADLQITVENSVGSSETVDALKNWVTPDPVGTSARCHDSIWTTNAAQESKQIALNGTVDPTVIYAGSKTSSDKMVYLELEKFNSPPGTYDMKLYGSPDDPLNNTELATVSFPKSDIYWKIDSLSTYVNPSDFRKGQFASGSNDYMWELVNMSGSVYSARVAYDGDVVLTKMTGSPSLPITDGPKISLSSGSSADEFVICGDDGTQTYILAGSYFQDTSGRAMTGGYYLYDMPPRAVRTDYYYTAHAYGVGNNRYIDVFNTDHTDLYRGEIYLQGTELNIGSSGPNDDYRHRVCQDGYIYVIGSTRSMTGELGYSGAAGIIVQGL